MGKRAQIQPGLKSPGTGLTFDPLCGVVPGASSLTAGFEILWMSKAREWGLFLNTCSLLSRQKSLSMGTLGKKHNKKNFEWGSKLVKESPSGEGLGYKGS